MKTLTFKEVRIGRGSHLDFIVSGKSLLRQLERWRFGFLPRLESSRDPINVTTRSLLLCESEGDTPNGRVGLYVCPCCGDYDCGVVSVRITKADGDFIWNDFAYENDFHEQFYLLDRLGPFRFEGQAYRQAIQNVNSAGAKLFKA